MSIVLVQVHIAEALRKLGHSIMIDRTFSIVAEAMPRLQLVREQKGSVVARGRNITQMRNDCSESTGAELCG